MLPKLIAQIVAQGAQVVGRAFTRALREEYQAMQAARKTMSHREGAEASATSVRHGISLQESMDILAVENLDKDHIQERYDHMFKVNDKKGGGSFYLQSKVFRAKERLDEEQVREQNTT